MKKITILFAMVLCLASCCRSEKAEDRNTQIVTFDYRVYTELPMTKAVNADGITSWITGQLPSTISLKLTDANGVKYNIETGSAIELPLGTYTVTGKSAPTSSGSIVGSDIYFSKTRPTIVVNTTIEVTYTHTTYTIPATYNSFGIVVDYTETASATYASSHGETGTIDFAPVGTSGIVFVNGALDTYILDVTVNPCNGGDKITTYTFKTAYSQSTISPNMGYYYILHPKKITSIEGGVFSYSVSNFQAVDITD